MVTNDAVNAIVRAEDPAERRSCPRFAMTNPVRFFFTSGARIQCGVGRMVDLSPAGARFESETQLDCSGEISLRIQWPDKLQGKVGVELVVSGVPVRSDDAQYAVAIRSFEFCIPGQGDFDGAPPVGTFCNVLG